MNIATAMDQVSARLDTISELHCFAYPPDRAEPPFAVTVWPEELTFDETYMRGSDRFTLPVMVGVSRVSDRTARDRLAQYAAGSGAASFKAVIESGTYTAFHTVRVVRVEFHPVTLAGTEYSGGTFFVDIFGSGTA